MTYRHRCLLLLRLKTSPTLGLAVLVLFFSYASSGCLSNRYVIPPQELARITQLPPESRGNQVLVVQALGDRRAEAIELPPPANPAAPTALPTPPEPYAPDVSIPPEGYAEAPPEGYAEAPPEGYTEAPPEGYAGAPPAEVGVQVGVNIAIGGHAGHPHGGQAGVGSFRASAPRPAVPPPKPGRTSGGGSGFGGSLPSGEGGSKEEAVAVVVVIIAIAVLLVAGLAVTEGVRYDGAVKMFSGQPVHLKDASGGERVVALADLVPADAAQSVNAQVMDDEGWGVQRLDRRPLDRKGFAFKVDMGSLRSLCACYTAAGFASNIQFGYFPHHSVGVLANLSLGIGSDSLGNTFQRHSISAEVQWFPLTLWRFHLGAFGHAGQQFAKDTNSREGAALGGGLILELSLTTRLALMARGDWTTAHTAPDGTSWANTSMITGGLAVY